MHPAYAIGRILPLALSLALFTTASKADEASVQKGMESFIGGPGVDTVTRTPYGGLYEVVLKSGELVYTDEKISFLLDGRLIDGKTRRDVTQQRLNQLSAIDFSSLPLDQAVKHVKGNGKRVMATFEDPNCGYCKRLGKELTQMTDITVYTFLYPILGQDSLTKARNIWCAKDKAKTWNDWIVDAKVPVSAECDTTALDRNLELGQKYRVSGTPTIFFSDGSRIGGYAPAAELEKALGAIAAK